MGRLVKSKRQLPFRLIECVPFGATLPNFALPLFAHPTNPNLRLIQDVDEVTGKIGGFRALDGHISSPDVISLVGPLAQPGGDVIYAFIGEDRSIHAGTLTEIESELRDFLNRNSKRTAVALQIFELIGSDQDKKHARSAM